MARTLVMKFGGAAVASPERFQHIARLISRRMRDFPRCVVVVSAMGDTTDRLVRLARQVHPAPPQREYDMLVTVGERISIALLAMALDLFGVRATSFTGSQSGIITCSRHAGACILDVKPYRLVPCLARGEVVIVAGFQGVSLNREITTLGRGGSDTTAVALGIALKAERVEFYKDVSGICEMDPKVDPKASVYPEVCYRRALEIVEGGAQVLAGRAIRLAQRNGMPLRVLSFYELDPGDEAGTWIRSQGERCSVPIYETVGRD